MRESNTTLISQLEAQKGVEVPLSQEETEMRARLIEHMQEGLRLADEIAPIDPATSVLLEKQQAYLASFVSGDITFLLHTTEGMLVYFEDLQRAVTNRLVEKILKPIQEKRNAQADEKA